MNKTQTLEALQRAAAHLLLTAEDAPIELAAEMRHLAARLQAVTASGYFLEKEKVLQGR